MLLYGFGRGQSRTLVLRKMEKGEFIETTCFERYDFNSSIKSNNLFLDSMKINETAIYKMATEQPLGVFGRVLLVSATGDRYVSPHSARIEQAKQAFNDQGEALISI